MANLLRIPPPYQAPLRALSRLAKADWDQLSTAFKSLPAQLTAPDLAARMLEVAPSLSDEASPAVSALLSLVTLVDEGNRDASGVAHDVSTSPDLDIPHSRQKRFAEALADLLCTDALTLVARAGQLLVDHEHIFQAARVLTDVRPVFRDDVTDPPAGAVIVETLKIDYVGADRTATSFFVALDQRDLVHLKKVIDRALSKTETLRRFLGESGLSYYEYQEMQDASTD